MRDGGRRGRRGVVCAGCGWRLGALWRRQVLPRSQYSLVVPGVVVVLERAVEGRELAFYDELGDYCMVPVLLSVVDAKGDEGAVVDGVVVLVATGRCVAHVARARPESVAGTLRLTWLSPKRPISIYLLGRENLLVLYTLRVMRTS